MARLCGAALGLLAFSVALIAGLAAGNPSEVVLLRAIWALLICCAVGLVTGWIAGRVLDEHASRRYREMVPEGESAEASEDPASTGPEVQGEAPSASPEPGAGEPIETAASA